MHFAKGHGLGNDYLVVRHEDLPWELTPARTSAICDRHRGIGSDGLLVAWLEPRFTLRIYNPDGSEAEKSGNGLRIFGAWLYGLGEVKLNEWFDVHLVKDTVQMRVEQELGGGSLMIRVAIGRAEFVGETELQLQHNTARANPVSLSNPHCVVFVDRLERDDFLERAPQLCTHKFFERGTNVQFARVIDDHTVEAWIWERGVGETLASGSSASAVAATAVHNGLLGPGLITVQMLGGDAEVEVLPDYTVKLRAPAQIVVTGEVRDEVVRAW